MDTFTAWLDSFINYEKLSKPKDFSLQTISALAQMAGNPQYDYRTIHIAGSKGKGSIAAMISAILTEHGLKTGLYTSPHIIDFKERITCNRSFFAESVYEKAAKAVQASFSAYSTEIRDGCEVTWFELVTLFAYLVFKIGGCEWGVFETGMGGRLDATNIVLPEATVISPIELEHTEWLGNTIAKIAAEKAGIIQSGCPVFCAEQKDEAIPIIIRRAAECGAPLYMLNDFVRTIETSFTDTRLMNVTIHWHDSFCFEEPLICKLRLPGAVQAQNAALVALCVKKVLPEITEKEITEGLSKAFLPGRFEIIETKNPVAPIILDGAHTVASILNTVSTYTSLFGDMPAVLLFACAADKKVDEIASILTKQFSRIILTRPGSTKSSNIEKELAAFTQASSVKKICTVESDFTIAIEKALNEANQKGIPLLICGSFYLVAEAKKLFSSKKMI